MEKNEKRHQISLKLTKEEIVSLKESLKALEEVIEGKAFTPRDKQQQKTADILSGIVANQQELTEVLESIEKDGIFHLVTLVHSDITILNAPWALAINPANNRMLGATERLLILKNTKPTATGEIPLEGLPLKILVMISSPMDLSHKERLDYEREEAEILSAFAPLMKKGGQAVVDFTDDGSLESLKRKIDANNYHILHFSGHGVFDERKGAHLLLEDPLSLKKSFVTAQDFAEAILKQTHTIPLVVLSSCQTAKGNTEGGLAAASETLLQKGIPAVVSMGHSIRDDYATCFAAKLYERIAAQKGLAQSFADARRHIRDLEATALRKANLPGTPLQWHIPNLYGGAIDSPVDWKKDFTPLKVNQGEEIFFNRTKKNMEEEQRQFIGRREDFALIAPTLERERRLLLLGMGGIGKTTTAKKLVQRISWQKPELKAFIFNEQDTGFSPDDIFKDLSRFCLLNDKEKWVESLDLLGEDPLERIAFLVEKIATTWPTLLLFDNMESFQPEGGGDFLEKHATTLSLLQRLMQVPEVTILLTGRYPLPELGEIPTHSLNDVRLNDFIRMCLQLELDFLGGLEEKQALFTALGGNFRSMVYFRAAFGEKREEFSAFLKEVKEMEKKELLGKTEEAKKTVLARMSQNLLFARLWKKATDEERHLARLLQQLPLPVTETAFDLLGITGYEKSLKGLHRLTLLQVQNDREAGLLFYSINRGTLVAITLQHIDK